MNHLRMCESVDTRLSIATPAFQHPRIIKSPPESLGTRLVFAMLIRHERLDYRLIEFHVDPYSS